MELIRSLIMRPRTPYLAFSPAIRIRFNLQFVSHTAGGSLRSGGVKRGRPAYEYLLEAKR
jgi:hypothetical protein